MPHTDIPGLTSASQRSALSTQHYRRFALSTGAVLQLVFLTGVFCLTFFGSSDEDLWWHLATGRYIVETGTIPRFDLYSYTMAGQTWVAHEWLAEVLMYLPYTLGGYVASVALFAAVIALAFGLVLRTLRLAGRGALGATLIAGWCAAMSIGSWKVRPQAFSFLLFALCLYLLVRSRQRGDRSIWLIPPIMAVWANLHAGYVTGLMLLALFAVGEAINRLWPAIGHQLPTHPLTHSPTRSWLIRYVGVATIAIAATALNPQGPAMLLYPFVYAGTQNASMQLIAEWQSPNFHQSQYFIFASAFLAPMLFGVKRRPDWALAVPALALAAMSLQSVRVIPFFGIAVAPYLATWLGGKPSAELQPGRDSLDRGSLLNWALLAVAMAVMLGSVATSEAAQTGSEPRTAGLPVDGARFVQEHGLTGNMINTYSWGSYLIWKSYPERRVFIDGRADMYGDTFVQEFAATYRGGSNWAKTLDRYDVRVALIEKDSALAELLRTSGDWREEFTGPVESVLVRTR